MTLLLVRHAESEGNAARVLQGWLDTPLSALGRRQAAALATRLAAESGATALYASTLSRAWETAAAVGEAMALEVSPLEHVREYHCGEAMGLTWAEVVERFGVTSETFWRAEAIPGSEGRTSFDARVQGALAELMIRHEEDVAIVVTHGGVLTSMIGHILGFAPEVVVPIETPRNTSITRVRWDRGLMILDGVNDHCHLAGVE